MLAIYTFDEKENIFCGRVANTHDLIVFQGKSVKETRLAFHDAIDEYIEWCKEHRNKPEKPYSTGYWGSKPKPSFFPSNID